MKLFIRLLALNLKRISKQLPLFLAGAIGLVGIAGIITVAFFKTSSPDAAIAQVSIGIVVQNRSASEELLSSQEASDDVFPVSSLITYLDQMQSTKDYFQFVLLNQDTAYEKLNHGEVAALFLVPSDVLSSILSGTNHTVHIVFPEHAAFASALLAELTKAGASMLGSAQSGIYTIHDLYLEQNLETYLQSAYDTYNASTLKNVLSRSALFHTRWVSATGEIPILEFYAISCFLVFLFLIGLTFTRFFERENTAFYLKLKAFCCHPHIYTVSQILSTAIIYFVLEGLFGFLLLCFEQFALLSLLSFLPVSLLIAFFLATFDLFCYTVAERAGNGILLYFSLSILLLFLSGCLLPLAFFPSGIRSLSQLLPPALMQSLIHEVLFSTTDSAFFTRTIALQSLLLAAYILFGYILLKFVHYFRRERMG